MRWSGSDLGGDMVIARRAAAAAIGDPLYNLVVVVDDAAMAITHVIRGEDHIANTAKQLLLYGALGLPVPVFAHTPLILNSEGRKLSKRDGVTSLSDFRDLGYTADALANYMTLLGWSPPEGMGERFSLAEAAAVFSFERVNRAGARFDWDKLNWLNAQVLHGLPAEQLLELLAPRWQAQGWSSPSGDAAWELELTALLGPSLVTLQDGVEQARPFFERPSLNDEARQQIESVGAKPALAVVLQALEQADPGQPAGNSEPASDSLAAGNSLAADQARALLGEAAKTAGVKKGVVMKSLRAALLGSLQGPDLVATLLLLQPNGEAIARLQRSL